MTPRAEKTQKTTKNSLQKLEKNVKISIKLRVFSDRWFERSHGRGGGGCTGDLMGWEGVGVGNSGVGGNSAVVGVGPLVGGQQGGVSNL